MFPHTGLLPHVLVVAGIGYLFTAICPNVDLDCVKPRRMLANGIGLSKIGFGYYTNDKHDHVK